MQDESRHLQQDKLASVAFVGTKTTKVKDRGGLSSIQMVNEFDKYGTVKKQYFYKLNCFNDIKLIKQTLEANGF